jgi:hypothetical protein
VRLQDGETIPLDGVGVSHVDRRHLVLDLLGEDQVGLEIACKTRRYEVGVMRPIPEFGNCRSSVRNVHLCAAGSHPRSGVSMAPGRNAAQAIFANFGLGFPGAC